MVMYVSIHHVQAAKVDNHGTFFTIDFVGINDETVSIFMHGNVDKIRPHVEAINAIINGTNTTISTIS